MSTTTQIGNAEHDVSLAGGGQRSTIAFPYSALDSAIEVATAINDSHGTQCEIGQLAGALNTTVASGKFRSMISAARIFGLIRTQSRAAALTELGIAIVDPQGCDAAKAEAFLAVPLYSEIFNKFDGRRLPPDPGLEAEIRALGVTEKSVRRARQTLQRSAATAGFFRSGTDRLARPPAERGSGTTVRPPPRGDTPTETVPPERADTSRAAGPRDQLLGALWSKLPASGEFPDPQRSQWLRMVDLALDMVYGPRQADTIENEPF